MIVYPLENYDSWISEEDADTYFDSRLHAEAWNTPSTDVALQTAFRSINELNLNITLDDDGVIASSIYSDAEAATILTALQQAQCEQALHELRNDLEDQAISSVSFGGLLSVKLPKSEAPPPRYAERAMAILRPYLVLKTVTRTR